MSKIDVLLLSYNRPNMVKQAIDSVLAQKECDFTLYIMDDNSNQETQDILKEYQTNNSKNVNLYISDTKDEERLTTIRGAILLNIALRISSSDYITYLTDDCYILPNKLKIMSDYLYNHPEIYTVYGIQLVKTLSDQLIEERGKNLGDVIDPHCKLDLNQIMHRRSALALTGYFIEDDVENYIVQADGEFFTRLANHCGAIKPVNQITDINIDHPNRLTKLMQQKELLKNKFLKGENHE